jgi:pyruvate dehydrogenase E2 component (dihydrolipoyllysine-residue acetyltransferase)
MPAPSDSPANIFILPDLGEGLDEAELIEWCVEVGQHVAEFDTLARMETAKAVVDVPSPREGTIAVLHGKPGQFVKVGSPLVTFSSAAAPGDQSKRQQPQRTKPAAQSANQSAAQSGNAGDESRQDAGTVVGSLSEVPGVSAPPGKSLAAPAVRRVAKEMGVDLSKVTGTGIAGRITLRDVQLAAGVARPKRQPPAGASNEDESPDANSVKRRRTDRTNWRDVNDRELTELAMLPPDHARRLEPGDHPLPPPADVRIPLRGVRRTIAEHLRHSVTHAVHFTVMDEADVTALDELRRRLVAASGEKVTLLPFVAMAACRILASPPFDRLNSTVDDEKAEIIQHRAVHLGIATETEAGLMVPVLRDAQTLGVLEAARRIAALAHSARERTVPREQLTGSTFTISNFGAYAGRFGTPIINYPEAAILAIGRAREGVVARAGMIGVGRLLPLSLAADHRVVDGSTAATALAKIMDLLQNPDQLMPPAR